MIIFKVFNSYVFSMDSKINKYNARKININCVIGAPTVEMITYLYYFYTLLQVQVGTNNKRYIMLISYH